MRQFDCLSPDCPLFGPHLLEASAGTGKTFAIEHVFVRLILEGLSLESILAVTFTRAATRELKARIRQNLEKAPAHKRLTDALVTFDQCQIFTIHGFCMRMLKEFAFEANVGIGAALEEKNKTPEALIAAAFDFLEHGIEPSLLAPSQISLLFKEFDSVDEIVKRLVRMEEFAPSLSFSELSGQCKAALHVWQLEETKLLEDFFVLAKNYKATVKGDFEAQVKGLIHPDDFEALLKEKGTLFNFLSPSNRKMRYEEPKSLHYPGFFDWAAVHIAPLTRQKVFPILQQAFLPIGQKILEAEEHLDPDAILLKMQTAIQNPAFLSRVQQKYAAVIIDEFQDTDAIQWDIFQKVFMHPKMRALYLVGDPKQSIYRFRKADIYTYLQAKELMGEENTYLLNTNFRSSKPLIEALNVLFTREWLHLPKTGGVLPYHPVQAGAKISSDLADGKGAIHFMIADEEDLFLPNAVLEIERLQLKDCAILVKDRYQAAKALELLRSRGIEAVAKSHVPLGQTESYKAIVELFDGIVSPEMLNIVMAGPFAKTDLFLPEYKALLEEKGLVALARELTLDADGMQIFEHLFAWEQEEGFSFEGLKRCLTRLRTLSAEEGASRRMEVNESAVQIMTMHVSKGLEFDIVFALGLASRTPASEMADELNAEKMRQLYVAMTRAKKRLYVPFAIPSKEPASGTHSPMELFAGYFEGPFQENLLKLSQTHSITQEFLVPVIWPPVSIAPKTVASPSLPYKVYVPSHLLSFTTLARPKESPVHFPPQDTTQHTMQTMPRGPETGIAIHAIFEKLFGAKTPIWRDERMIESLVHESLLHTPLEPWQKAILQMVHEVIAMPLHGIRLKDVDQFQVEVEFIFSTPPDYVLGFIDLIFLYDNKVYFVDWKTNWLDNYDQPSLQKAMEAHDYGLQAKLYAEAIGRHYKKDLGGAFYLFVRGCSYITAQF